MWFLLAVILTTILVWNRKPTYWNSKEEQLDAKAFLKQIYKYGGLTFTLALIISLGTQSIVIVPAGHRGVIFDKFTGVKQASLKEGLNFVTPFVQSVVMFDVRIQKDETSASSASKDLQDVKTTVALNLRPRENQIHVLYQKVGTDYVGKVVHPAVVESVKAATAKYTAEELITKREDVKNMISDLLKKHLDTVNIEVHEMYITDFDFSKEFSEAIESKQIAEQQALKAKRDLDRVRIEADQKVATARAEAESLRMQKEAITPMMLQLRGIEVQAKAIEKWNGELPQQMIPGSAVPFIDLNKFTPSKWENEREWPGKFLGHHSPF